MRQRMRPPYTINFIQENYESDKDSKIVVEINQVFTRCAAV